MSKNITKAVKNLNINEKKLNIICLHGYRQNGETFKSKIGSFRKIVKSYADFSFIDAPHRSKPLNPGDSEKEEERSWWFNQTDGTFDTQRGPEVTGFDDSLKLLEQTWQSGNFDAILAFSQGASFLSVVCAMSAKNLTPIKPKLIIMISGFKSVSIPHDSLYNEKIAVPSIHINGKTDQVISHSMHVELEELFEDPEIYHHEGGHHLPATGTEKPIYKKLFEEQISRIFSD